VRSGRRSVRIPAAGDFSRHALIHKCLVLRQYFIASPFVRSRTPLHRKCKASVPGRCLVIFCKCRDSNAGGCKCGKNCGDRDCVGFGDHLMSLPIPVMRRGLIRYRSRCLDRTGKSHRTMHLTSPSAHHKIVLEISFLQRLNVELRRFARLFRTVSD
jgi:hypothetical protein